jgi:Protein of unknown function (DUF3040)
VLSDAEQRQLTAIESQLGADDPIFVRRFTRGWRRRPRGGWRGLVALFAVVVAATAAVGAHVISHW